MLAPTMNVEARMHGADDHGLVLLDDGLDGERPEARAARRRSR